LAVRPCENDRGLNQVGCIDAAQGSELDYVGVIVGQDLTYDFDAQPAALRDHSLSEWPHSQCPFFQNKCSEKMYNCFRAIRF
jgi:hypothetical protein